MPLPLSVLLLTTGEASTPVPREVYLPLVAGDRAVADELLSHLLFFWLPTSGWPAVMLPQQG